MPGQTQVKERSEHKPLPPPNTHFYEVTDTLSAEDDAVSWGPALRRYLMDPLRGMMKTLGNPKVTPTLKKTIADGVLKEAADRSVAQLAKEENKLLPGLLRLRSQHV